MADEERRLVTASQGGDITSFNQLVRLYETRVFNLCYRMLGDSESAADASQDTFLAAYRNIRSFRGGSFRSWLLRIATNTCYDVLRARKRRPTTSLDAVLGDDDEGMSFDPADPGEAAEERLRHELGSAIQHSLAQFPEDQRVVVILSDIQGLSYDEIAAVTGTQIGTVKSRLSRGRARLRDLLKARELLPSKYRHEDS